MNFWKKFEEGIEHILRLDEPPHKVALAIAIGIFVAFTPFLGVHLIIASCIAWAFRVRIRIAAIATLACNPWTMPFIYGGSLILGNYLVGDGSSLKIHDIIDLVNHLGGAFLSLDLSTFKSFFSALLTAAKPFALGALILGSFASLISYLIAFFAFKHFKIEKDNP